MFNIEKLYETMNILDFMIIIKNNLYDNYKDFDICKKMSPNMKRINFVDYNSYMKHELKKTVTN